MNCMIKSGIKIPRNLIINEVEIDIVHTVTLVTLCSSGGEKKI